MAFLRIIFEPSSPDKPMQTKKLLTTRIVEHLVNTSHMDAHHIGQGYAIEDIRGLRTTVLLPSSVDDEFLQGAGKSNKKLLKLCIWYCNKMPLTPWIRSVRLCQVLGKSTAPSKDQLLKSKSIKLNHICHPLLESLQHYPDARTCVWISGHTKVSKETKVSRVIFTIAHESSDRKANLVDISSLRRHRTFRRNDGRVFCWNIIRRKTFLAIF